MASKIYTTIDSRMQKYAEDAVEEHLSKTLQPAFFKEKRGSKSAPYTTNRTEVSQQQIDRLIEHAMQQTDRYRVMQKNGASKAEIEKIIPHASRNEGVLISGQHRYDHDSSGFADVQQALPADRLHGHGT